MSATTKLDLPAVLSMVADGRITLSLSVRIEGDEELLTDDLAEVLAQHKPALLRRLAWDHVWADAEPLHGWVEWARGLSLPAWTQWRDRANAIMATLPDHLEPIDRLEESQRRAWQELVGRVGLDAPPPRAY